MWHTLPSMGLHTPPQVGCRWPPAASADRPPAYPSCLLAACCKPSHALPSATALPTAALAMHPPRPWPYAAALEATSQSGPPPAACVSPPTVRHPSARAAPPDQLPACHSHCMVSCHLPPAPITPRPSLLRCPLPPPPRTLRGHAHPPCSRRSLPPRRPLDPAAAHPCVPPCRSLSRRCSHSKLPSHRRPPAAHHPPPPTAPHCRCHTTRPGSIPPPLRPIFSSSLPVAAAGHFINLTQGVRMTVSQYVTRVCCLLSVDMSRRVSLAQHM